MHKEDVNYDVIVNVAKLIVDEVKQIIADANAPVVALRKKQIEIHIERVTVFCRCTLLFLLGSRYEDEAATLYHCYDNLKSW